MSVLAHRRRDARRDLRLARRRPAALQTDLPTTSGCRFLHFVPIAVFAALVTPSLEGGFGGGEIRATGAGVATIVAWRPATSGSQSPLECSPSGRSAGHGSLADEAAHPLALDRCEVVLVQQPAEPGCDRSPGHRDHHPRLASGSRSAGTAAGSLAVTQLRGDMVVDDPHVPCDVPADHAVRRRPR